MKDLNKLRNITSYEVLEKAREKGFVIGGVIIDSQGFVKFCRKHGVYTKDALRFLQPY